MTTSLFCDFSSKIQYRLQIKLYVISSMRIELDQDGPIPHDNKTGDKEFIQKAILDKPVIKEVQFIQMYKLYGISYTA